MGDVVTTLNRGADEIVALSLNGGRVTRSFRQAVFDAAAREGMTVNELVIRRVAERLRECGFKFSGVFIAGDMSMLDADHTTEKAASK